MVYDLAKNTPGWVDFDGPSWVPCGLWGAYRQTVSMIPGKTAQVRNAAKVLIVSAGARELWEQVGKICTDPNRMASDLPEACRNILVDWDALPKVKPSDYSERVQQLSESIQRVSEELLDLGLMPDHPSELLLCGEELALGERVAQHNLLVRNRARIAGGLPEQSLEESEAENTRTAARDTYAAQMLVWQSIPSMEALLDRLADDVWLASDPVLERPNGVNASRNYFIRCLCAFFRSYREPVSPAIIAKITCLFFEQGVSENEVSQQANSYPSGRRIESDTCD